MTRTQHSSKLNAARAGILFCLAGSIILMGIITAESFYPNQYIYTTHNSMISDLGATEPPNSIITQPSATIFNLSMMLTGILTLIGTYFLFRYYNDRIAAILIGLVGLGALGWEYFMEILIPSIPYLP